MASEVVNGKRINLRAGRRYVIERIKANLPVAREDLIFLCEQVVLLEQQLDDERDAAEVELEARQEAMRLAADERYEREMRSEPT